MNDKRYVFILCRCRRQIHFYKKSTEPNSTLKQIKHFVVWIVFCCHLFRVISIMQTENVFSFFFCSWFFATKCALIFFVVSIRMHFNQNSDVIWTFNTFKWSHYPDSTEITSNFFFRFRKNFFAPTTPTFNNFRSSKSKCFFLLVGI